MLFALILRIPVHRPSLTYVRMPALLGSADVAKPLDNSIERHAQRLAAYVKHFAGTSEMKEI